MASKRKYVTYAVSYPSGLNVRVEPSTDSEVIKVLRNGEQISADTSVSTPDGWVAVKGGGYCMRKYLR